MTGLSAASGRAVPPASDEYVRRSVADVLTTPIGSRVMRRDYGSYLPDLVDQPLNDATRLKLYGATALALMRWHRRSRLKAVRLLVDGSSATLQLDLVRTDLPRPQALTLTLPLAGVRHRPSPQGS
ncbi:phage baseplate assembly protein W [Brevundimonas bullata]|uniref:Phage baseplate assembly protein W n=1 Tax=Brevundimonas bullata TaxID=13160 RepID=A0A7W7INW8_9CAUL|nr:GPW/gp25 family protein [Brevundimonas bullata]MBB4797577.1 phage baseplate assembly protein W [Brevundimonas bullata]MBB6382537.1 phage baseplate assembly protein W [Brevundimonas bullata]